jgi:signal transduction histidine kinase
VPKSSLSPTRAIGLSPPTLGASADACGELAAWLQQTREAERQALASELHDELGAILTAARLDAAWLAAQPCCQDPAIAARLASLSRVLAQGIGLKRRIVEDLYPTVLTHLGLAAALEQLTAQHRERAGAALDLRIDDTVELSGDPALALYRIAQESLTNILKYARARRVQVCLRRERRRVVLTVRDDGCGFDPSSVGCGHHGLIGMRQRMRALQGEFDVVSHPDEGTTIRASVCLPDAAPRVSRPGAARRGRAPATAASPGRDMATQSA